MQIQIENENVRAREAVSTRTGKAFKMREQDAIVYGVGRFPVQFKLTLPDGVEGYKVGVYDVTTPLTVGRYGLEASRDLGLVPSKLRQPAQQAA